MPPGKIVFSEQWNVQKWDTENTKSSLYYIPYPYIVKAKNTNTNWESNQMS